MLSVERKVENLCKVPPFFRQMPDAGGCDPHRDCQSYPRKGFSLFQEMDLSGAG